MKKIKTLLLILPIIFSLGIFNSVLALVSDSVVVTVAPPTPNTTATPGSCGSGAINISWTASASATSYTLNIDNSTSVISGLTSTSYSHTGLVAGSSHSYKVLASNSYASSLYSNVSTVNAPTVCAPSAPTGLTATAGSCGTGTINLSWAATSGATSYSIKDGATVIATPTGTSYSHTGLVAGSSHSYTIAAVNAGGTSAYSSAVARNAPTVCAPSAPTGLTATAGSCGTGTINLSWAATSGATSYSIKDGATVIATPTGTSYSHTGLVAGSSHSYTIAAVNAGGTSAYSSAVARNAPASCLSLTVTKAGTGSGTVTSSPSGISCGSDCTEGYNLNTAVTLSASASSGSVFAGWSGACTGTGSCSVTMDSAKNVTATFNSVSLSVSASSPYYVAPGSVVPVSYTATVSTGSAECRMLDNNSTPLTTTFSSSNPINVTIPASSGDYGYYVQCRSTLDNSIVAQSSLIHIYGVTITLSATTSYSVAPGATVPFAYTASVQYGALECALLNNSSTAVTTYQASSPISYTVPNSVGSYGYYVKCRHSSNINISATSALITVTTACPAGTSWNSSTSTCVGPTGTISSTNCNIDSENNCCNSTISWSVLNPIGGSAVTTPTNITVSTLQSGSTTYGVCYGSRNFYLYNNSNLLSQSTSNATCKPGTAWNASLSKCKTATGSLTATGCTIESSKSSCVSNLVWSTINPSSTSILMNDTNNVTIREQNSGNINYSIVPGVTDFKLLHNGSVIATASATAACAGMTEWNGSACVLKAPEIDVFKAEPSTVFYGRSTTLTWSSNASLVTTCTGNGFNTGGAISGSVVVTPTVKTTYSLTCSRDTYSTTKSVTVKVIDLSIKEQ